MGKIITNKSLTIFFLYSDGIGVPVICAFCLLLFVWSLLGETHIQVSQYSIDTLILPIFTLLLSFSTVYDIPQPRDVLCYLLQGINF